MEVGKIAKPHHYTKGAIETIDHIEDMVEDPTSYRIGNAIKYLARWKYKNGHKDLLKVVWYVGRELVKAGYGVELLEVIEGLVRRELGHADKDKGTDSRAGEQDKPLQRSWARYRELRSTSRKRKDAQYGQKYTRWVVDSDT